MRVLQSKHIEFEEVDISDPLLEKEREFMRQHSTAKSGQKPLPPQVFADDKYCGVSNVCLDDVVTNCWLINY